MSQNSDLGPGLFFIATGIPLPPNTPLSTLPAGSTLRPYLVLGVLYEFSGGGRRALGLSAQSLDLSLVGRLVTQQGHEPTQHPETWHDDYDDDSGCLTCLLRIFQMGTTKHN